MSQNLVRNQCNNSVNTSIKLGKVHKLFIWLYILPLSFDFRKTVGAEGTTIQILLLSIVLFAGGLVIIDDVVIKKRATDTGAKLKSVTLIWWLYLISTVFTALIMKVAFEKYLLTILPYLLVGISLAFMRAIERNGINLDYIFNIILISSVINLIWRASYALFFMKVVVVDARWQILSPSIPIILGYILGKLLLRCRFNKYDYFIFVVLSCVVLLSITRGFLVSIVLIFLAFVSVKGLGIIMLNANKYVRTGIFVALILSGCLVLVETVRPEVINDWTGRLFNTRMKTGTDNSCITRIAEYKGQIDSLLKGGPASLLVGNGVGSWYKMSPKVLSLLPYKLYDKGRWVSGHSPWVYSFYSGGILFGLIVPFLWARVLYEAFATLRIHASKKLILGGRQDRPLILFLICFSYTASSIGGNIFGERFGGLQVGLIVGMLLIDISNLNLSKTAF